MTESRIIEAASLPLRSVFAIADETRRQQGRWLDRLGFGPQCRPSRVVRSSRIARLRAYDGADTRQPVLLIVPAPIKAAYIWDLAPDCSVVAHCRAAGLRVYMIDWQRPNGDAPWPGLAEYADEAIAACIDAIAAETGAPVFVAGHSLGGTLAAIFASLHRGRVRGLIALEAPIAFRGGRLEAAIAASPAPAAAIGEVFGNVPGTFLDWASACADPGTFNAEPWLDWLESSASAPARRLHWQVRRWSLDESPMAGVLFDEVAGRLYRENAFAEGRLHVRGRRASPRALDVPIIGIVDPRSRIVPLPSVEAYAHCTGSEDATILHYAGDTGVMMQHVGVLVGGNAHASLWPAIVHWIRAHAAVD